MIKVFALFVGCAAWGLAFATAAMLDPHGTADLRHVPIFVSMGLIIIFFLILSASILSER